MPTMKFRVKVVGRSVGLRRVGTLRDWVNDVQHEAIERRDDGPDIIAAGGFFWRGSSAVLCSAVGAGRQAEVVMSLGVCRFWCCSWAVQNIWWGAKTTDIS